MRACERVGGRGVRACERVGGGAKGRWVVAKGRWRGWLRGGGGEGLRGGGGRG